VRVLPHEFCLIQLHGFLTALPRPRQCCLNLGLGLGLVKTASPTPLQKHYMETTIKIAGFRFISELQYDL